MKRRGGQRRGKHWKNMVSALLCDGITPALPYSEIAKEVSLFDGLSISEHRGPMREPMAESLPHNF